MNIHCSDDCVLTPVQELIYGEAFNEISPERGLMDQVTHEIIGTKKYRHGNRPTPEVEVTIRKVIREAINIGEPIPIMVPYGASKQGDFCLDLAEVMSVMQLVCLTKRVRHFYKPGVNIRIRLEDATDEILFGSDWLDHKTAKYMEKFVSLVGELLPQVEVIKESSMVDFNNKEFDRVEELLFEAIHHGRVGQLEALGWVNGLPLEQLVYYRRVYDNFYTGLSRGSVDRRLAKYFACAIIRKMQGGTGELQPSIILYFGNPVPGTNQDRRVYYKTNTKQHTHRAPWLGKGHIDFHQGIPYVAGWNGDGLAYEESVVHLNQVPVEADYVLSE